MMLTIDQFVDEFRNSRVLILGFGREGKSSYNFLLQRGFTGITVADSNPAMAENKEQYGIQNDTPVMAGDNYLDFLGRFDKIIKTPGITMKMLNGRVDPGRITSQAELFMAGYRRQVIGITGTKGKSTTSSLIYSLLKSESANTILVGNIGVPPFDKIGEINAETLIVFELSSHQLEMSEISPHIAVVLNIYQEHLDHYADYQAYQQSKFNIFRQQQKGDHLIYNRDDLILGPIFKTGNFTQNLYSFGLVEPVGPGAWLNSGNIEYKGPAGDLHSYNFSDRKFLPGQHNLMNIMAGIIVARINNVPDKQIEDAVNNFRGLPHRLEYVGEYGGFIFYNDSIATIPEATIHAIQTLKNVDTVILGGVDRGVDYKPLADFLSTSEIRNIILTGRAGEKIQDNLQADSNCERYCYFIDDFDEIPAILKETGRPGTICLLSPAAASYDHFRNFEERGNYFKETVSQL